MTGPTYEPWSWPPFLATISLELSIGTPTQYKWIITEGSGEGRICRFLKSDRELGQKMCYSTEILHVSCFYKEQYGTVKKRQSPPNFFFAISWLIKTLMMLVSLFYQMEDIISRYKKSISNLSFINRRRKALQYITLYLMHFSNLKINVTVSSIMYINMNKNT